MKSQRSAAVTTIAILHLVGGGLGLIGSMCGVLALIIINSNPGPGMTEPGQPDAFAAARYLRQNAAGYAIYQVGGLLIGLVLDVLLLSGGLGLLNRQRWSRYAAIIYAVLSIAWRLFALLYVLLVVAPAISGYVATTGETDAGQQGYLMGRLEGGTLMMSLFIIYPIAVLIVMLLPSTRADFELRQRLRDEEEGGEALPPRGGWREDDNDDDDRTRRGQDRDGSRYRN